MKVKDVIEFLSALDPDTDVILQNDAEGYGYSPLGGIDSDAVYIPDSTWSGTVYSTDWTADDAGMDEDEWDEIKAMPHCVVLYPVN